MKTIIKELDEKNKIAFDKLVSHPIQSWEWGEFRKKTGNKVVRLGIFEGKELIEGYQLTIHRIPKTDIKLGVFLKGPMPSKKMFEALKLLGLKENLVFIRMEPNVVKGPPAGRAGKTHKQSLPLRGDAKRLEKILERNGAKPGRPFFTKSTFWIDLLKTEEELLGRLHPKTRYNIKVAQKHGVEVVEDNSPGAFEKYLDLMEETTRRQGFYAHTAKYHRLMWESLHPKGIARLLTARYKAPERNPSEARRVKGDKKEIITAWILFVWKDFLYYPYGASTEKYKNIMANYAMMWEAIKFGKKLGLKTFDLWGREEGKGFTRFKEGFSPVVVEFIGTWDFVLKRKLYHFYRTTESLRWRVLHGVTKLNLPFLPKPKFR